jgi:hypothetical protein
MTAPLAPRLPLPPCPPALAVSSMLGALAPPEAFRPAEAPTASPRQPQVPSASEPELDAAPPRTRSAPQARPQRLPLRTRFDLCAQLARSQSSRANRPSSESLRTLRKRCSPGVPRLEALLITTSGPLAQAHWRTRKGPSPSLRLLCRLRPCKIQRQRPIAKQFAFASSSQRIAGCSASRCETAATLVRVSVEPAAPAHAAREVEHLEVAAEVSDLNDARPDEISEARCLRRHLGRGRRASAVASARVGTAPSTRQVLGAIALRFKMFTSST